MLRLALSLCIFSVFSQASRGSDKLRPPEKIRVVEMGVPQSHYACSVEFPEHIIARDNLVTNIAPDKFDEQVEDALRLFFAALKENEGMERLVKGFLGRGAPLIELENQFAILNIELLRTPDHVEELSSLPLKSPAPLNKELPQTASIILRLRPDITSLSILNFSFTLKPARGRIEAAYKLEVAGPGQKIPGPLGLQKPLSVLFNALGISERANLIPYGHATILNRETLPDFMQLIKHRSQLKGPILLVPHSMPELSARTLEKVENYFLPNGRIWILDKEFPSFAHVFDIPEVMGILISEGIWPLSERKFSVLHPNNPQYPNGFFVINFDIHHLSIMAMRTLGWESNPESRALMNTIGALEAPAEATEHNKALAKLETKARESSQELEKAREALKREKDAVIELNDSLRKYEEKFASLQDSQTANILMKDLIAKSDLFDEMALSLEAEAGRSGLLEREMEGVKAEQERTRKELAVHRAQLEALTKKVGEQSSPFNVEAMIEEKILVSLDQVVRLATIMFKGKLAIPEQARRSARESMRENPAVYADPVNLKKAWKAFKVLGEIVHPYYFAKNTASSGSLKEQVENGSPLKYAMGDTRVYRKDREFLYGEEKLELLQHIGFDVGGTAFRIYLDRSKRENVLVLGHIGTHLETTSR